MPKRLFLLRHAESVNNVDKREAKLLLGLKARPTKHRLLCVLNLLRFDMNSPLSARGEAMVQEQHERLMGGNGKENFISENGITLILHSSLSRARDTCLGIFQQTREGEETTGLVMICEHAELYEKSLVEHVLPALFERRVRRFHRELAHLFAQHDAICIVGHAKFFRQLLSRDSTFSISNCEILECEWSKERNVITS